MSSGLEAWMSRITAFLSDLIENPSMLNLRRDGPETILFFRTCIEKKLIQSLRRDCISLRIALKIINSEAERPVSIESILFWQNCIEVESILRLRRDCSESMLFYQNYIENEWTLSLRRQCPELTTLLNDSYSKWTRSQLEWGVVRIDSFPLRFLLKTDQIWAGAKSGQNW